MSDASASHAGAEVGLASHKRLPDKHIGTRGYLAVWGALAVLTAIEIGATFLPISHAIIVAILLILATAKAGLVALYFMHLRFDGTFLRAVGVGPFFFVFVLLVALLVDLYFIAATTQGLR
jgi:cytochrome c oxidase subunit 4